MILNKLHNKSNRPYSKIEAAMILAAGFGKRLLPITKDKPKALVEIQGSPILGTIIKKLQEAQFKNIIINTHYLADKINHFIDLNFYNQILISHEKEILETGGGIKNAYNTYKHSPMLIINCDALFFNYLKVIKELLKYWDPNIMDFLVVLKDKNTLTHQKSYIEKRQGDFDLTSKGKLCISEDNPYIYTGLYIIKPEILNAVDAKQFSITKDFLIPNLQNKPGNLQEAGNFYGLLTQEEWIDIGSPASLEEANLLLKL